MNTNEIHKFTQIFSLYLFVEICAPICVHLWIILPQTPKHFDRLSASFRQAQCATHKPIND